MNSKGRSVWIGLGTGVILLLLFSIPFLWNNHQLRKLSLIMQANLISAAGDGQAAIQKDNLLITQKPGSVEQGAVSVSVGGRHWYSLSEGSVILPYDRQLNRQVYVAAGNRMATAPLDARAMAAQKLEVNIGTAPKAPPLVFFEPKDDKEEASIAVQGATALQMEPEIPGVNTVLRDDMVFLSFDAELRKHHFFSFRLISENAQGKAFTTVAVLPKRAEEVIPIRTAQELQAITENPQGHFLLMNDIDLRGVAWQPIGYDQTPFSGVLDGNGHAITGLSFPGNNSNKAQESFSLFTECQHAVIRNLRMMSPQIDGTLVNTESMSAAALVAVCEQSLLENCAVFGGHIKSKKGYAAGLAAITEDSVLLHLFNSARIEIELPGDVMMNGGGIVANMNGFMAYCANEGNVSATHLTGGLFGFGPKSSTRRCINSGAIHGAVFIGEYPPGAFFQTIGDYYISDCVFTRGSAGRAGSAFGLGGVSNIRVIAPDALQNKDALSLLGALEGENAQWLLGDADAKGPLPSGIRTLKRYRPGGDGSEQWQQP
ncbi:MAG: hypothetical protein ACOX6Y_12745 [Christensenellales bacterium]